MKRLDERSVRSVVHAGHAVDLVEQDWILEPDAPGDVPLAMTRTMRPDGATRGTVVLVHGFAQNRVSWAISGRSLVAWLAERGWRVVNLELRGHGRSRGERQPTESFSDYVRDVIRVSRALEPAFFVGHSLGGAACYAAAAERAPMAGIVGIGAIFSFAQHNWALRLLGQVSDGMGQGIGTGPLIVRTKLAGRVLARLYGASDVAGYALPISGWWPGSMEPELLQERLRDGFDWTSVQVWLDMSRWAATGRFDHYQELWPSCGVPVLAIAGDEDHLCGPRDAAVAVELAEWDDAELLVFDQYTHGMHWGHLDLVLGVHAPDHVWPALHDWLATRSALR